MIDPLSLPWQVIITGMAFAEITAMLAARQPARTVARVPMVAALSGHPPRVKAVHRSARKGLIATAAGMCLLAGVCITVLGGAAGPRSPVAVRIALRDWRVTGRALASRWLR